MAMSMFVPNLVLSMLCLLMCFTRDLSAYDCMFYDTLPGIRCDNSPQHIDCPTGQPGQECIITSDRPPLNGICSSVCSSDNDCIALYGANAACRTTNTLVPICQLAVNMSLTSLERFNLCAQYVANDFPCALNGGSGGGDLLRSYCLYTCQCPITVSPPTPAPSTTAAIATTVIPTSTTRVITTTVSVTSIAATTTATATAAAATTITIATQTSAATTTAAIATTDTIVETSATSNDIIHLAVTKAAVNHKKDDDLSVGVIIFIIVGSMGCIGAIGFVLYRTTSSRRVNPPQYDPLLTTYIATTYYSQPPQQLYTRNSSTRAVVRTGGDPW